MKRDSYLIGAAALAGVILAFTPTGDKISAKLYNARQIENTKVISVENYDVPNDLGMHFKGSIIRCDSLEGNVLLSGADADGLQVQVGDLVNLRVYTKFPIFGTEKTYRGILMNTP